MKAVRFHSTRGLMALLEGGSVEFKGRGTGLYLNKSLLPTMDEAIRDILRWGRALDATPSSCKWRHRADHLRRRLASRSARARLRATRASRALRPGAVNSARLGHRSVEVAVWAHDGGV